MATADANAGGFAVREQSAYGQGIVLCRRRRGRIAVVDVLESGDHDAVRRASRSNSVLKRHHSLLREHALRDRRRTLWPLGGTGDTGDDALVPAGYFSWQIRPNLWIGMSVNAPFGLSVNFPDAWAGRKLCGGRQQPEDLQLRAERCLPHQRHGSASASVCRSNMPRPIYDGLPVNGLTLRLRPGQSAQRQRRGWGYGFTAGVTLTPTPTTTIGIGYRSAINQKINGTLSLPASATFRGHPHARLGQHHAQPARHRQRSVCASALPRSGPCWARSNGRTGAASAPRRLAAEWCAGYVAASPVVHCRSNIRDGWFFSARRRISVERRSWRCAAASASRSRRSPIDVRSRGMPDNDRIWLSVGAHLSSTYAEDILRSWPIRISS